MDLSRLIKQIVEFCDNRSQAKEETIKWVPNNSNFKSADISQTDIQDRNSFRQKAFECKVGQRELLKRVE